jgi:uncharacterized membrane protein
MHQEGDTALFDIGEEFGAPNSKEPRRLNNFISFGWDAPGAAGWSRDRSQRLASKSGRYECHPGRPTSSRVTDTLIHWPMWNESNRTPVDIGRGGLCGPNPTGWRAQLPPGCYRVWVLMGDAVFPSPASCFVQGKQVFEPAQREATTGFRYNSVIANVGPRLVSLLCLFSVLLLSISDATTMSLPLYSGVLRIGPVPALVDDTPEMVQIIKDTEAKKEIKDGKREATGDVPNEWSCTGMTSSSTSALSQILCS